MTCWSSPASQRHNRFLLSWRTNSILSWTLLKNQWLKKTVLKWRVRHRIWLHLKIKCLERVKILKDRGFRVSSIAKDTIYQIPIKIIMVDLWDPKIVKERFLSLDLIVRRLSSVRRCLGKGSFLKRGRIDAKASQKINTKVLFKGRQN